MNPPGKTTLLRMRQAAYVEMASIEASQDARIAAGWQQQSILELEHKRDDMAGLFRLVDCILDDKDLARMITERMRS